jgi:hypothetical protein
LLQEDFSAAQHGSSDLITKKLCTSHRAFENYGEGSKRIDLPRFDALRENDGVHKAVRRARRLSNSFTSQVPSSRDPSTDLYLLLESLTIVRR